MILSSRIVAGNNLLECNINQHRDAVELEYKAK
jgi:hypothetical protein